MMPATTPIFRGLRQKTLRSFIIKSRVLFQKPCRGHFTTMAIIATTTLRAITLPGGLGLNQDTPKNPNPFHKGDPLRNPKPPITQTTNYTPEI